MVHIQHVNFACQDPDRLAAFWADALEGERLDLPPSFEVTIVESPGEQPDLMFREAPRGTDRDLPIHLDLEVEDREAAVERLEGLGATVRETKTDEADGQEFVWAVLEDPVGNGFCVTEYE